MVADPNNNLVYYSGGDYYDGVDYVMAVSKSTNGGTTWSRMTLTSTFGFTYALAVDPSNSNIVYAGGNPGMYKSTNAGTNWALSSTGLSGIVRAIGINPSNGNILYAGTDVSVFKSTNAGANWADCGLDTVQAILIHSSAPETVYAGTQTGVYQSANSGGTWTAMNTGLDNLDITSLGINPGFYLFCGTRGNGMYSSSLAIGVEEQREAKARPLLTVNPNPFRTLTNIKIDQPTVCKGLKIYDANGRLVKTFTLATDYSVLPSVVWDGTNDDSCRLPAGIYFCRLENEGMTGIEKIIFLR